MKSPSKHARIWQLTLVFLVPAHLLAQTLNIEIWYGMQQPVGFLGDAQDDFNLMGHVSPYGDVDRLYYTLNDGEAVDLSFSAFRRLARDGDFNADIPIESLKMGSNRVRITAVANDESQVSKEVIVVRESGAQPLPVTIRWSRVTNPQQVGQFVDGKWALTSSGLQVVETGYDRLFLIGNRTWKDYEITADVTVDNVDPRPSPQSGPHGLGLIMRFAGHVVGGHREFPDAQPKWGYQPFGAIGWLRWNGGEEKAPEVCYYAGDSDVQECHGTFAAKTGTPLTMRMRAKTLEDNGDEGVTRYSFKVWERDKTEPSEWNWQVEQSSEHALRKGGVALVAHRVKATFGEVNVVPLGPSNIVRRMQRVRSRTIAAAPRIHWSPRQRGGLTVVDPHGRRFDLHGRTVRKQAGRRDKSRL
jgi:hypothetical protein